MDWLGLSILSMLAKTGQSFSEKTSQQKLGSFLTLFLLVFLSTIFILPLIIIFKPFPQVNNLFWIGIVGSVCAYLVAKPMRLFAIGKGDISHIIPLTSFNSLFALIFGWLFLNEVPTNWGLLGVTLITFGGFVINYDSSQSTLVNKLTQPVKSIFASRVMIFLFISLLIGPISVVFDKLAINNTFPRSPYYVLLFENMLIMPLLLPVLHLRKINLTPLKNLAGWKTPLIVSIFYALANVFNFFAINNGNIGYVSAIRQLSSVLAVLGGYYILKEGDFAKRFTGCIVMAIGAFLIATLG